jgi:hypothetical protein
MGFASHMFDGCSSLTVAPDLPNTTTLYADAYAYMFAGCKSLINPPEIPIATLNHSCYESMFAGCTMLKFDFEAFLQSHKNIELKPHCFANMVSGCTTVNATRNIIPVNTFLEKYNTNYAEHCYDGLYAGCELIEEIPDNYLTDLVNSTTDLGPLKGFTNWFSGCKNLINVPTTLLPFTNLTYGTYGCYESMFKDCTSLTNAPELPATTLTKYCYKGMFEGCTSLTTVPSILPATTLVEAPGYDHCYYSMFKNCESLIEAPEIYLDAATNVDVFYSMFEGCTSLNYVKAHFTAFGNSSDSWNKEDVFTNTYRWLYYTSRNGTFVATKQLYDYVIENNFWNGAFYSGSRVPHTWKLEYFE